MTYVLGYHAVFTLQIDIVLEKNRSRSTIFKSILEQLRKIICVTNVAMKLENILPYTIKKISDIG